MFAMSLSRVATTGGNAVARSLMAEVKERLVRMGRARFILGFGLWSVLVFKVQGDSLEFQVTGTNMDQERFLASSSAGQRMQPAV